MSMKEPENANQKKMMFFFSGSLEREIQSDHCRAASALIQGCTSPGEAFREFRWASWHLTCDWEYLLQDVGVSVMGGTRACWNVQECGSLECSAPWEWQILLACAVLRGIWGSGARGFGFVLSAGERAATPGKHSPAYEPLTLRTFFFLLNMFCYSSWNVFSLSTVLISTITPVLKTVLHWFVSLNREYMSCAQHIVGLCFFFLNVVWHYLPFDLNVF